MENSVQPSVQASYAFGDFRLDPVERLLLRGQERVELPPRVFDTLLILVQSGGRLIEKAEFMRQVWPDSIVEENNLSQAIYLLRKILHDGDNGGRYIETVPKRGYRFVAPVRTLPAESATPSTDQSPRPPSAFFSDPPVTAATLPVSERLRTRWLLGSGAFLLVALVVIVMLRNRWQIHQSAQFDGEPIRSVAVLPLLNLSSDAEQEYFADGMTDELITDLARVRELKVVSRTSVMQYKGVRRPLPQIGRELGVDAVIEGSVLRSGDHVRITAQLIRTATDTHIWAQSYEAGLKDVLSLQARIAEAITTQVKLSLTSAELDRLHAARPVNPEAYDAYIRGRYLWNRRNVAGFEKAISYFNQAIEKDPNFALAYSGLADSDILLSLDTLDPGLLPAAKTAAEKALQLDDGLAEVHTSVAAVRIFQDWDWGGAETEFRRALELNPNYAPAHHWYGNILLGPLGRHDEAIAELKRAQDLDPLSLIINTDLGFAYYLARQYDRAFAQYQSVVAMDGKFVPVHRNLRKYYAEKEMYDDWIQEMAADFILAGNPRLAEISRKLYAKGGFRAVTSEFAASRGTMATNSEVPEGGSFCSAAEGYAELQATRQALAALEKCYQKREPGMIYLKVDPVWDGLRSEPAFQKLEHGMGLQ